MMNMNFILTDLNKIFLPTKKAVVSVVFPLYLTPEEHYIFINWLVLSDIFPPFLFVEYSFPALVIILCLKYKEATIVDVPVLKCFTIDIIRT